MYWLIPIQNWWQNWCGWCIRDSIPHFKHFYKANFYWLLLEVTLCEMYSLIIISLGNYNNLECSVEVTEIQGGTNLQLELFTLITFDPCVAHELIIWNDSHDLQWQEEILHWSQNNTRFFHFRIFNPVYLKVFICIFSILNQNESHLECFLYCLNLLVKFNAYSATSPDHHRYSKVW